MSAQEKDTQGHCMHDDVFASSHDDGVRRGTMHFIFWIAGLHGYA